MSEETNSGAPKRPTFLTVLCILSFIGIGIGLVSGVISLATAGVAEGVMEMNEAMMEEGMADYEDMMAEMGQDDGGMLGGLFEQAGAAMEHARTLAIIGLICNLLCLFGVIRMWNLKKQGFYIYTVGELAPAFAGIILVGGLMATGLIIPIIFVVLYGLNLKHMH